ncbi:HpcH/HpaI aldolase/citrate lyase family protein [Salinirubellus sp. GCM10025818]|uniref:HpcH/HpaI aldolase/citrate lyase family protein n=1 Tax=Salinirubellus TaxID=2162630 RepID=UPI0030D39A39
MVVRRSELTTPGSSMKMMEKAAGSDADEVMLDLEDAVAPSEKVESRAKIVDAIHEFDWEGKVISVRINDLNHPNAHGDLIEVVEGAGEHIDTIMVPKIEREQDVYMVEKLLSGIERDSDIENTVGIEVLIEEVEALQRVDEIAATGERLEGLVLGFGDYSASQGMNLESIGGANDYPGDVWHYHRNRVAVAARVNGIDAIDGPYGNFSDPEGYRMECERSHVLGFVGKWAIHPSQIEIANDVYAPEPDEVEHAQRVVEAMEAGQAEGKGAVQLDGEMIDEASIRKARETIDRAREIGMIEE